MLALYLESIGRDEYDPEEGLFPLHLVPDTGMSHPLWNQDTKATSPYYQFLKCETEGALQWIPTR